MGRYGLGAVLAIALLVLAAAPASAALPRVDVYPTPGDATSPIEVTIPPERTSATVPVQVVLGRKLPARKDPRFALSSLLVRDPVGGRAPTRPRMMMVVAGRDITTRGFHPRTRGTFSADLLITGIDTFGTFEADLRATIGWAPLASRVRLVIRRYPHADLELAGAAGDGLAATVSGPVAEFSLPIRNTTLGTADGVALSVGPIRAVDGRQATVEVVGGPVPTTLGPFEAAVRSLRVSLPAPGAYAGTVRLAWGGASEEIPIRVERVVPPLGVEVVAVQGAGGEVPWCVDAAAETPCTTDAIWLALRETMGREVTLDAPTLQALAHRTDGRDVAAPAVDVSASLDCVDPRDDAGAGDTAMVGSAAAAVQADGVQTCGRVAYDPAARRLTIGPGAIARLRLGFAGDLAPGAYAARLAIGGEGATPLTAETTLALRLPATVGLLVLLGGAILALPVRGVLTTARRHARRRARISAITGRLESAGRGAPDPEARAVVALVQAHAARVLDASGSGWTGRRSERRRLDDLEARVRGLTAWLQVWTDAGRQSPGLEDRIRSRLVTVSRTLGQPEPLTPADRRTLEEIDSLADRLAPLAVARVSPIRDPASRRGDVPGIGEAIRQLVRDATRTIRWSTPLETLLLIALTVIAGLAFVWAPNPTWGSTTDLVVALLWSATVVIVASVALVGLSALRSQLGRADLD